MTNPRICRESLNTHDSWRDEVTAPEARYASCMDTTTHPLEAINRPEAIGGVRLTCFIRYQIDPFQRDEFKSYAENWGRIIPKCGGHLLGYFLPDEGTNDVAWGLIAFDSLASYEIYRRRLKADPGARENFAMARTKRFILREERTFLESVDGTLGLPSTLVSPG